MTMIPGAWEPRRPAASVQPPVALGPVLPVESGGGHGSGPALIAARGHATERAELSSWIRVSIFAGTLLAATWIAMAMFF